LRGPLYNEVKEGAALLLSLREPPQPLLDQLTRGGEDVACSTVDLLATRRGREQLLPFGESCVLPIAAQRARDRRKVRHQNHPNISTVVRIIQMTDDRCDLLCLDLPKAEALRSARPSQGDAQALAAGFRALGDPTRLTIALALRDGGELCVCDLAWVAERAENLVSHHVRALRAAGLANYRRDGKMALYSLTLRGVALLDAVADTAVPA
jgi:DNA-binding transcriptional ArsR family regulator